MVYRLVRDQWFLAGILLVTVLTLGNPGGVVVPAGRFLVKLNATEWGIVAIFVLSGLELQWEHLLDALCDWKGILVALAAIFVLAPLLAWLLSLTTSSEGIRIGLLLVGVVPTTLASGVVMSGAAGGRLAHALVITIAASALSIVTVPLQLSLLIHSRDLRIDLPRAELSWKMLELVLLPLLAGMAARKFFPRWVLRIPFKLNLVSRLIVLLMIFVGLQKGREDILGNGAMVLTGLALAVALHILLAVLLWWGIRLLQFDPGRRESVFFMGVQKTLPLCVWLQTNYFASYGMALVVCVFYHISQLVIGSYVVGILRVRSERTRGGRKTG